MPAHGRPDVERWWSRLLQPGPLIGLLILLVPGGMLVAVSVSSLVQGFILPGLAGLAVFVPVAWLMVRALYEDLRP